MIYICNQKQHDKAIWVRSMNMYGRYATSFRKGNPKDVGMRGMKSPTFVDGYDNCLIDNGYCDPAGIEGLS